MKKLILVASVAIFGVVAMTSCKKTHTCKCSFDVSTGITDDMTSFEIGKSSKKDAKAACEAAETTWAIFGAKCSLK